MSSSQPAEGAQLDAATQAFLQGVQNYKIYFRTVRADRPAWSALDPTTVIVPPRCANIRNADFVAIQHKMTADDLLHLAIDGHLDPRQVAAVVEKLKARTTGDPDRDDVLGKGYNREMIGQVLDRADGISSAEIDEPQTTTILEIYCKLDLDGDGVLERAVLWLAPGLGQTTGGPGTILALYHYPFPFEEWPITRFEFEHTSQRPYSSRGGSEMLSVHQAMVNKLHNSRLDAIQITLAPMFQMRASASDQALNIKFMPGAVIPVQTVGDIAPLVMDTRQLLQNMSEENQTKALAESYVGIFDPAILAQNSSERRTAHEVEAVVQQTQSVFGQDAKLFQVGMKEVHKQLWDLIEEFGPDEEYILVTGEQKPRLVRKADIAFDYDIRPSGTPSNTSKALAMSRAREALQIFAPDMTGLINKRELFMSYFNVIDRNMGKRVVRSEEEAALIQQMLAVVQQAAQMAGQQPPQVATP
jgi:hypothetical protein